MPPRLSASASSRGALTLPLARSPAAVVAAHAPTAPTTASPGSGGSATPAAVFLLCEPSEQAVSGLQRAAAEHQASPFEDWDAFTFTPVLQTAEGASANG